MNEIDLNEIASNVISDQLSSFLEVLSSKGESLTNRLRFQWKQRFKTYEESMREKYSRSRSFFYRDNPVNLYKFYVPAGVQSQSRQIEKVKDENIFEFGNFVVIQGSGGCGKSVLLRHITLETLSCSKRIPAFVELRNLNNATVSLNSLILDALTSGGLAIDESILNSCLESGIMAIFLDGFDELNFDIRDEVISQIKQIQNKNSNNRLVLTSRPDGIFLGWHSFNSCSISPLSLEHALELIRLSPATKELKDKFSKELKDGLFERHKSFLSNPLLLSIMLITYNDSADIPQKLSVFYSQAYSALYQQHDAWKGGYKRQRKCSLDIQDFHRIFSAFSLVTYDKRLFSMSHLEATQFIRKAAEIVHIKTSPEDFLNDLLQAVCLLVDEGLSVSYTHRSFQEYFAARFIADAAPNVKVKLLDRIKHNAGSDNVLAILHEMQPDFVEIYYLLPELNELFTAIEMKKRSISRGVLLNYLRLCFETIATSNGGLFATIKSGSNKHFIVNFALNRCGHGVSQSPAIDKKIQKEKFSELGTQSFKTANLGPRHPFVAALYENGQFFGASTLERLWDIAEKIEEKKSHYDKPLEDLLFLS